MKRLLGKMVCSLLLVVLCCGILPACTPSGSGDGVEIITTAFPAYDIARALTKNCENVRVRLLLSPGTESHTYDPSAADMMAVCDADLFIYIGEEADVWAEPMMQAAGKNLKAFALTDGLTLLRDDHEEADAHVWTNPENVIAIVERLMPVLCEIEDVEDALVAANGASYIQALQDLDQDFRDFWASVPENDRLLVFGDRFPFRYFAEAYGVSYLSAFPGCSHESEPSANKVMELINTVRSRGISTIFHVELSNHRIADTIAAETGTKIALLHSCHNVTQAEFDQGATYLSLMQENLTQLREAFRK